MASSKGARVRQFFDIEARTLLERFRVMETLIPHSLARGSAHRGEEGRHIEALVRDFLNKHLPTNVRAVSGFILRPSTKIGEYDLSRVETVDDQHSRQLDIIVYDFAAFPVYERFEEFAIVPPEGAIAIISVKKTLYKPDLRPELSALREAVGLCRISDRRSPLTAIFAFSLEAGLEKNGAEKCFDAVLAEHNSDPFDSMVTEICAVQAFTVFKFREGDSDRSQHAKYVRVDTAGKSHIALQRLINSILSVYYDPTRRSGHARPGFVSFEKGIFKNAPLLGYVKIGAAADLPGASGG